MLLGIVLQIFRMRRVSFYRFIVNLAKN